MNRYTTNRFPLRRMPFKNCTFLGSHFRLEEFNDNVHKFFKLSQLIMGFKRIKNPLYVLLNRTRYPFKQFSFIPVKTTGTAEFLI